MIWYVKQHQSIYAKKNNFYRKCTNTISCEVVVPLLKRSSILAISIHRAVQRTGPWAWPTVQTQNRSCEGFLFRVRFPPSACSHKIAHVPCRSLYVQVSYWWVFGTGTRDEINHLYFYEAGVEASVCPLFCVRVAVIKLTSSDVNLFTSLRLQTPRCCFVFFVRFFSVCFTVTAPVFTHGTAWGYFFESSWNVSIVVSATTSSEWHFCQTCSLKSKF